MTKCSRLERNQPDDWVPVPLLDGALAYARCYVALASMANLTNVKSVST